MIVNSAGMQVGFVTGKLEFNFYLICVLLFISGIDGNWSPWSSPGPCDKTCGGGVQVRKRTCTNPPPSGDGKKCEGPSTKTESCNTQECKENTVKDAIPASLTAITFPSHLILHFAVQIYKMYHLSKMTFVTREFKPLCGRSKGFFNFY